MSQIFYAGIDLGTSRSSIATSTGKQISTQSCVGYPKDIISQKRFGKAHLFGDEALNNRLALDMVYPLAEGVICNDERALETTVLILKHLLDNALPEKQAEDQVYLAVGVPAQANIKSKQAILEATKDIVDKIIIVSEPFAVAYSINRFDECLVVDIGAGTTDLCRMHGAMPDESDQVTLNVAGNYFDDELGKGILAKFPKVQISSQIIKRIKEKHGYVSDTELTTSVNVILSEQGIQGDYEISEVLHSCCEKFTTPISQAIQQLIGSFDPDFQARLRDNIIVAGGGSRLKGLDIAIEKSLLTYGGGKVSCVQDAEFCGCIGALKMCQEMPEEYWKQL